LLYQNYTGETEPIVFRMPLFRSSAVHELLTIPFTQGWTNHGCLVAMATKFCIMVSNIYGSSVWNLLHVTFLTSRNFEM